MAKNYCDFFLRTDTMDIDEVITQIRACLVSTKGKCDIRQVKSDYYMLMGCEIPYRKLGYNNLEEFICSIPSLTTTRVNGQVFVDAKKNEKSLHISNFVNKQKPKKKRPPARQVTRKHFSLPPRWRPKNNNNNWRKPTSDLSSRFASIAHTQAVSSMKSPVKQPDINEKMSVLEIQSKEKDQNDSNSLSKKAKERLSRRIFNSLEDISVDSSIYNVPTVSSANVNVNSSHNNKFIPTGDHVAALKIFVEENNLGQPSINIQVTKSRSKTIYYCKIQIDNYSYSTYPKDIHDEETARQDAAKNILIILEEQRKFKKQRSLIISSDRVILNRIPPMVKMHECGIWSHEIESLYVNQYNEQLPMNWLEILDSLQHIAVTRIHEQYVLHFCNPDEVFQKKGDKSNAAMNISVLPNTVNFNEDDMLVAEITCITSTSEIWCCQHDRAEWLEYNNMVQEMERYYQINGVNEKIGCVQIGGHYVAWNDQTWCRVRVFDVNDENIHCFCIDYGDEWIIRKDSLFNLNPKFANIPAQAFVCKLLGLEELDEASKTSEKLQEFLGKIVNVQVGSVLDDEELNPNDPALPVVFYDIDTQAPINEEIITAISMEIALPVLPINTPTEVYVSNALDDGLVFIQIRSKGYNHLMSLIEKTGQWLIENEAIIKPTPISKSNGQDTYLIQYDNNWQRVRIVEWCPFTENDAQIQFLDTGKFHIVNINNFDFYSLNEISDVICKFPEQARVVRLPLKNIPKNFVKKINQLMPLNEPVVVKTLKIDEDEIPVVEFFKRSETDNVLFSVNMTIATDSELKNNEASGDGNNNKSQSNKLQRLMSLKQFHDVPKNVSLSATGNLTLPELPDIGEYFDVKVSTAVSPSNFFVQPYKSQGALNQLMSTLQERCKNVQFSPLDINDIIPGRIYGCKHTDGQWYRACVTKIHLGIISVYFCDFGYYGTQSLHEIVPLDIELMELPFQAINAKLADAEPINSNWSTDDCEFFSTLINKKYYVSQIKGMEKDDLCRYETVLKLTLIDTSTVEDIYINKVLIDRGIIVASK